MPIITISRGSFAGGKAVAEALGQRLGIPAFGREEVLAQAATDYGISEAELTQALNEHPPFWQQVLGKRAAYVKCVTAVLLDHASAGNLIYHGNVGHLLLYGVSHALRVRVVADLEYRIKAAMEQTKLNRDEAIAYIRRVDKDRARWAQLLYGVDWEDPTQYSVILNLSEISVRSATETILRMTELEEFRSTPESRKQLEDLRLSCQVWAALAKDPETHGANLQVEADGGAVVIHGTVGTAKSIELIPQLASKVEGVKAVRFEAVTDADWVW